ncbi:MAG: DUF6515 family protein [Acidobacteria bacterium]|nr:DUF6515 family protein [Acidobacteriota bacterium]
MQARNRRFLPLRAGAALALTLLLVLPEAPAYAQRARAGGGGRGSVRSVNRNASGTGGSWSGRRTSGTTSRSVSGNTSSRATSVEGRGGQTATGTRNVTRSDDEVTVNRDVQSSTGASRSSQKTYEMDNGRVDSVERNTQATNRYGQTAEWEGKAERSGYGWEFEGEGKNRYGQKVEAEGYGARGLYGSGVVADVEGGRSGDRTVVAGRAYGGPVHAARLPYGARPYTYYGRPYYGYGGVYYRPYYYRGVPYYGYIPPPWGCYYTTVPVGAIALTVAGAALLYSDGTYYKTTYVEGATQYQVVAPPAGASLPAGTLLPADRATITIAGVTYYLYGNTFYKRVVTNGQETFVVVTKPAGVVAVKALPDDFEPMQAGSMVYFRSKDRWYLTYLDPSGEELYVVVDAPAGAVPAVPGEPGGQPQVAAAAPASAPAAQPMAMTLTAQPGTPLTVRVATEVSSGTAQAGQRFQGNLDSDLVTDGRVMATRGTRVYGRVVAAQAGTGTGGAPQLTLELTDVEVGGRVVPLSTEPVSFSGEAKKAGRKVLGAAALGAGIGGMIDGGEGAAWGAGAGAVVGVAAAKSSPGNQVAVAPGTALEFRLAQPLSVAIVS